MSFNVNLTVEVQQVGNGLAIQTPVSVQLVYDKRRWRGICESPWVETEGFEEFEEALIACGQQTAAEVQMAVVDRPVVLARITPDDIPSDMFE